MPITVNPASQITAAQWVEMIQRSPYVPPEVKQGLTVRGNTIIGPTTIKTPKGMAPGGWRDDIAAAFASQHWEITTGQENFALIEDGTGVRVHRTLQFDLQRGEFGPVIASKTGFLRAHEDIDAKFELDKKKIEVVWGVTISSAQVDQHLKQDEVSSIMVLTSLRALVVIFNRIEVTGKPKRVLSSWAPALSEFLTTWRFPVPEDIRVMTFLHEFGAHAGRMSQGKTSKHGPAVVEDVVTDIEGLFPAESALKIKSQISGVLLEGEGPEGDLLFRASGKGRTPGPQQEGSAQGRTPGPQR